MDGNRSLWDTEPENYVPGMSNGPDRVLVQNHSGGLIRILPGTLLNVSLERYCANGLSNCLSNAEAQNSDDLIRSVSSI